MRLHGLVARARAAVRGRPALRISSLTWDFLRSGRDLNPRVACTTGCFQGLRGTDLDRGVPGRAADRIARE